MRDKITKNMAELSKRENIEAISNPEQAVKNALSVIENKDALDPVGSSEWAINAKGFLKSSCKLGGKGLLCLLVLTGVIACKLFEVAGRMLEYPDKPEKWLFADKKEKSK